MYECSAKVVRKSGNTQKYGYDCFEHAQNNGSFWRFAAMKEDRL